jgi:hypothetical protein
MPETITAVVISGAGTGDGSVPIVSGTIAKTASPLTSDVRMLVIPAIVAITVRFGNTFLAALVGLLVAAMTPLGGKLLYTSDFFTMIVTCSSLALPGAFLGLIKDLVTIFGKLENKYPLLTGNV